jgi:ABC-type dipeptide/oligopeptide/nickel transport system permease subunit
MRRNLSLPVGLFMLLVLALFLIGGRFFVDLEAYRPISEAPLQAPSRELPFGSDRQGRNMFAVAIVGTPDVADRADRRLHRGRLRGGVGVHRGVLRGQS